MLNIVRSDMNLNSKKIYLSFLYVHQFSWRSVFIKGGSVFSVLSINSIQKSNQESFGINKQNLSIKSISKSSIDKLSFGCEYPIPKELRPVIRKIRTSYFDEMKNFKFQKELADGFKNLKFKESIENYIGNSKTYILGAMDGLNVYLSNGIASYISKVSEERNKIIKDFDVNDVKGFITQLLNHKDKNPFKISYFGHSFGFNKDSIIIGAGKSGQPGFNELSINPQLNEFFKNINNIPKSIIHNGKEHSVEPIFDRCGELIGISAKPVKSAA